MKIVILNALVLILGLSCSSNSGSGSGSGPTACTNDVNCPATQTCQNKVCAAQTFSSCKTNAICSVSSLGLCQSNGAAPTAAGPNSCATVTKRYVFETTQQYKNGAAFTAQTWPAQPLTGTNALSINSAADADKACQWEADNASNSKVKGSTFAAWIATTTSSPYDRLVPSRIPANNAENVYLTTGGQVSGPVNKTFNTTLTASGFAAAAPSSTENVHSVSINYDAAGAGVTTLGVKTGSQSSGKAASASENCNDWTVNTGVTYILGLDSGKDATWYYNVPGFQPFSFCGTAAAIYCIQVNQ